MKTKEEVLKSFGIKPETKHHSYDYLYAAMLKAMEKYLVEYKESISSDTAV